MGGINIGLGQLNVGHLIGGAILLGIGWFGSLVFHDHDALTELASSVNMVGQKIDGAREDLRSVKGSIVELQHAQNDLSARVNCIQGVGTVQGCQVYDGRRRDEK